MPVEFGGKTEGERSKMEDAMDKNRKINQFISTIENLTIVRSVRNGLIHITPVLIIGAIALILQSFRVEAYQ